VSLSMRWLEQVCHFVCFLVVFERMIELEGQSDSWSLCLARWNCWLLVCKLIFINEVGSIFRVFMLIFLFLSCFLLYLVATIRWNILLLRVEDWYLMMLVLCSIICLQFFIRVLFFLWRLVEGRINIVFLSGFNPYCLFSLLS